MNEVPKIMLTLLCFIALSVMHISDQIE
jgi:hypothetical protein